MLEQGGNAVDAAVAVALAQGVVDPMMCGLGGTARIFMYTRSSERVELFAGRPYAGRKSAPASYEYERPWELHPDRHDVKNAANYLGHTAAVVPTALRVMYDVHSRFGKLPWRTLVEPAVALAHEGFIVYPYLYRHWDEEAETAAGDYGPPPRARLTANPEAASIYLKDGRVLEVGDLLRQPDYGRTLERIASGGADAMYQGEMARVIAADFTANGGFVTLEDLNAAKTISGKTLSGTYRDATVVTDGPPAAGHSYIQALNILEALQTWASADRLSYFDALARTFHAVYAFRAEHNGDPEWTDVPLDDFLSKSRAKSLANEILEARNAEPSPDGADALERESTSSSSVIDSSGNAVILTHSNGSSAGVATAGLGFLYNNHMHNFDPRPGHRNSIAFGKIPDHGTPLVMWFRKGELVGLDGSLSRFAFTADLQVTLAVADQGVAIQDAIEAPRLHAEYCSDRLYVEPGFPSDVLDGLQSRGWRATTRPMTAPLGFMRQDKNGRMVAGLDPRADRGRWPPTS